MSMKSIRRYYDVPAKRGAHVIVDGTPGVITGARGPYLMVKLDDRKVSAPCHPTWRVEYIIAKSKREAGR